MPTEITVELEKNISFKDFVFKQASAFSHSVRGKTLNDYVEPQPSQYNNDKYKELDDEFNKIKKASIEYCNEQALHEFRTREEYYKKEIEKVEVLLLKYKTLYDQTKSWESPEDHNQLKDHILKRIQECFAIDCDSTSYKKQLEELKIQSGIIWRQEKIKYLLKEMSYHYEKQLKENTKVKENNIWVRQLIDSLET